MLRALVLLLLLANGAYFAWSQGHLRAWGFAPQEVAEPQRLKDQIRPEAIVLVRPQDARPQAAAAQAATECQLAGPFDENQSVLLRRALEALLPPGSWALDSALEPARWIIYMGKYANAQALAAKRAEVSALRLKIEDLNNDQLEPGFSLGSFPSQKDAESALANFSKRGVRTAKVVQEAAESRQAQLRIAAVDENLRSKLELLKPALAGQALRTCS